MNQFKSILIASVLFCLYNCSSSRNEPLYYEDGIANLAGMWVSTGNLSQDIVLDVDYSQGILSMKLLGKSILYQSMSRDKDQVLITFKDTNEQKYYMIGQLENKNEMRLSFTKEEIKDFVPVGQLGKPVYKLQRIKKSRATVVASRN